MANRQNLLDETDFETSARNSTAALSVSKSNSPLTEQTFKSLGTPQSAQASVVKSRQFIILCGMLGMLGWVYVFGIGMLIDSKPFRDALAKTIDWYVLFGAILTFTPTNVALLAIFAGFLGGCASLLMYSDYDPGALAKQNGKASIDLERLAYLQENPISSALRGFVVYLTFLAGTVFSASGAFATTTQDQYCRLAGAVAVLAFGVGYDPTVFRQVLSMVTRRADSGVKPNQPDRSPEAGQPK